MYHYIVICTVYSVYINEHSICYVYEQQNSNGNDDDAIDSVFFLISVMATLITAMTTMMVVIIKITVAIVNR